MKIKSLGANQTEITLSDYTTILVSYETPVACHIPGEGYYKTEQHYSPTTSKHINKWLGNYRATQQPQWFFDNMM